MHWAAILLSVVLGGVVHTVTGFGAGIVIMAILPYFFDMVHAPAVSSAICMTLSAGLAWRNRGSIQWRLIPFPAALYITGSVLAINVVRRLPLDAVGAGFGLFLMLLSGYYLFLSRRFVLPDSPWTLALCSVFSGLTAGLFGVGGPLMAICFLARTRSREAYTGSLQCLFLLTGAANLLTRVLNGIYTAELVPVTLAGIAAIQLGRWLGTYITQRLNGDVLRRIIYLFVGVSGAITLLEHI